jgi:hypothetical protein
MESIQEKTTTLASTINKTEATDKAKTELNLLSGDIGSLVPPKNNETEEVRVQMVGGPSKEKDSNMQTQTKTRVLNHEKSLEGYVVSQEVESFQQQHQKEQQQPARASTPSPKPNRLSTALSISAVAAALCDPSNSPPKSKSSHAKSRSPTPTKVQGGDRGGDRGGEDDVVMVSKMEWENLHDEKLELEMALKKVQGILNLKSVAGSHDACVGGGGSPSRSPLPLECQVEEILGTLNTWQRTVASVAPHSTSTTAMTATTTAANSSNTVISGAGETSRVEELEAKIAELEARMKESEREKKVMYSLDEVQERVEEARQEVEVAWGRKWEAREREWKDSVVVEDEKAVVGDDGVSEGRGNSGRVIERFVMSELEFNGRFAAERRRYVRDNVQEEEGEEGGEEVDVELLVVSSASFMKLFLNLQFLISFTITSCLLQQQHIHHLESELSHARQQKSYNQCQLNAIKSEAELSVGDYKSLLLRHEELWRLYREQEKAYRVLREAWEIELKAHKV